MTQDKNAPAQAAADEAPINIGELDRDGRRISPWAWVPSVNFLQGMQYILVTQMFIIVFFTMGVPNRTALFWLGLLSLPWTIKPLWGPLVDKYWTKRNWTTSMQFMVGICLLGAAFTVLMPDVLILGLPAFFIISILVLFAVAFASATHDIACDGYYMLALNERQQAFFVGIRSTAFRVGWIFTLGPLVFMADVVQRWTGPPPIDVAIVALAPGQQANLLADMPVTITTPSGEQGIIVDTQALRVDAGTSATLAIRLAQDPGPDSKITVVLKERIKVPEVSLDETVLSFTHENWDQPKYIHAKVDPRLRNSATAMFRISAGNVALGWAVVLLTAGGIYFLLALYHRFMMPRAFADSVETTNRPPFWVPAVAVAATVLVPFLLGYTVYRVMMAYQPELGPLLFRGLAASTEAVDKKLYDFLYKLMSILTPTLAGFVLFFAPGLKKMTRSFFRSMSDFSRIGFADVFETFFAKEKIAIVLSFILLYRLGEIPLSSLKSPFLLGSVESGGMNMSLSEFAFANSIIYVIALIVGGLLSGWLISTFGLKRIIWILVAFMHLPNLGYLYMAYTQPIGNLVIINALVGFEAFGYGIGLSAFLMVMIMAAKGPYRTAHYALCTGFMALGVMIPQMPSGFIQEAIGYQHFFLLVMVLVIPGCLLIPFLPIDASFGKKGHAAT
ncbi:MAG: hypothetical protein KF858_04315 [Candidatus Sumerlaeia bacterium]|nr:hypothetical protein [Candidatus Sumerlaeia bacterium]